MIGEGEEHPFLVTAEIVAEPPQGDSAHEHTGRSEKDELPFRIWGVPYRLGRNEFVPKPRT
jgi:hypothetical protein